MGDMEFLLPKSHECPVCGNSFKNPALKSSKARMIGSDQDLRPRYAGIDTIKYDVVLCPKCGYTALERFFGTVTQVQKQYIQEKICRTYQPREEKMEYTYEDALYRYKMALLTAIVKQAPESEKAYIGLKTGWLLRGWRESLSETESEKIKSLTAQEDEFLKSAMEGFVQANMKEDYPICGMDENTMDYLVAVLHNRFGEYETATKLVSGIIANRAANPRIKDRARELKDDILKNMKEKKAAE